MCYIYNNVCATKTYNQNINFCMLLHKYYVKYECAYYESK